MSQVNFAPFCFANNKLVAEILRENKMQMGCVINVPDRIRELTVGRCPGDQQFSRLVGEVVDNVGVEPDPQFTYSTESRDLQKIIAVYVDAIYLNLYESNRRESDHLRFRPTQLEKLIDTLCKVLWLSRKQFNASTDNGFGIKEDSDGSTLICEFFEGMAHGVGVKTYTDGRKYIGEFQFGKQEGLGRLIKNDGVQYLGQFQNGVRCGLGQSYSEKGVYVGPYNNNQKNGKGIFHYKEGASEFLEFKEDALVAVMNEKGTWNRCS